jgi:hypothetical protein
MESEREVAANGTWSRGRLLTVIALIFGAHVGLIFAFGERKPITPRPPAFTPELRLTAADDELLALNDPTLFALPHSSGFSGSAWMHAHRVQPESYHWSEPYEWQPLPVEQLGAVFSRFMQTNQFARFSPELKPAPQPFLSDTTPSASAFGAESVLQIEGDLHSRAMVKSPPLASFPGTDLLTNSVIQVLVDDAGNVVSTMLLPPGSGSKEADRSALGFARSSRFAPTQGGARNGRPLQRWTVGRMVFQWRTVPPLQTNSLPVSTQ